MNHVAQGKQIPPFLLLHVADHVDTTAQALRLRDVLRAAGLPAENFAAPATDHVKLDANLGLPDDPATKALFVNVALPAGLVAVTRQLSFVPTSDAVTVYACAVAPAIGVPSRSHW